MKKVSLFSLLGQNKIFLGGLLLLGFAQYLIAAVSLLSLGADPKNAVILGYSLQRVFLFVLTISPGAVCLFFAFKVFRGDSRVLAFSERQWPQWSVYLAFLGVLLGLIVWTVPVPLWGSFSGYFERLRPLGIASGLLFFEFLLWVRFDEPVQLKQSLGYAILFAVLFIAVFLGVIFLTGLGVTPDGDKWNLAGVPLLMMQLVGMLFIGVVLLGVVKLAKRFFSPSTDRLVDVVLFLALYVFAIWLWTFTPLRASYFNMASAWPYYQSFPDSDARVHDVGALSILNGWGIGSGGYTDKPLYMVFLAILHLVSGFDYTLLIRLQVVFLALMVPFLYLFGKAFHSRFFGVVIGLIAVIRLRNAIVLANSLVFTANPRMLMTEIPTLLGMILVVWLLFLWMKNSGERPWLPLATGGALGALSLLRMNPALLFPAIPVITLLGLWKNKKGWVVQSGQFVLGFILLIAPWIFTGQDSWGRPYFFIKFFDVIQSRYSDSLVPDNVQLAAADLPLFDSGQAVFVPLTDSGPGTWLDLKHFPGFVFNHFVYNAVSSFLSIPDSVHPADQDLVALMQRPIWSTGIVTLESYQVLFVVFNLVMVALGLAYAWDKWKWAGLSPLLVFFAYSLSLALARTSGTRYLPPIDWIIYFYFALGLMGLLQLFPLTLRRMLEAEPVEQNSLTALSQSQSRAGFIGVFAILLAVALSIPVADNLVGGQSALCGVDSVSQEVSPLLDPALAAQMTFMRGQVLYPAIDKESQTFILLVCRDNAGVRVAGFDGFLRSGQVVVVGWPKEASPLDTKVIISADGSAPELLWLGK